jgi:hypothetical protein
VVKFLSGYKELKLAIEYERAKNLFENNRINDLILEDGGLRFLKLRSMSRKPNLVELFSSTGIALPPQRGRNDLLHIAYNSNIDEAQIESVIKSIYVYERANRIEKEEELIDELYKLQSFDWGGLYQNNLEKL